MKAEEIYNKYSKYFTSGNNLSEIGYALISHILEKEGIEVADSLTEYINRKHNLELYSPTRVFSNIKGFHFKEGCK